MRGKVTTSQLNVRNRPGTDGKIIGTLTQDTIVEIHGEQNNWFEIDFDTGPAFASANYIRRIYQISTLKARVLTARLNVRNGPSLTAQVIGTLQQDTLVNLVGDHPDWIEIEFNHGTGFISDRYVDIIDGGTPSQGTVTAASLNLRAAPSKEAEILGRLAQGNVIPIHSQTGNWYETRYNGVPAYVHNNYVAPGNLTDTAPLTNTTPLDEISEADDFATIAVEPDKKYSPAGSNETQAAALTWNKFGNLLNALSKHYNLNVACAVAVFCVESSGKGFEQNNNNRLIIRFENHKFWTYWGKLHPEKFKLHFKYNSTEVWKGHQWRSVVTDPWEDFHGNQLNEWRVLEFARNLDDSAALKSISMGAPQIMGFHYATLGFATAQEMFEKFSNDIRYHILGFFDFVNSNKKMLKALQDKDFTEFAGLYNGSGQKEKYGGWIQKHYDAFKTLSDK